MVSTKSGGHQMTQKPAELVEGLIVKTGAYGRRTYSAQAKRILVQLCKAPGVSVAGLALAHGINANLLRRWIVRFGSEPACEVDPRVRPHAALLPVKVVAPNPPAPAKTDGNIEIQFRSITIRLQGTADVKTLTVVLDCLATRA
jgi:transposase